MKKFFLTLATLFQKSDTPKTGRVYTVTKVHSTKKEAHAAFYLAEIDVLDGNTTRKLRVNCSETPIKGKAYATFALIPGVFIEKFQAMFGSGVRMLQPARF